ncbi:hypothetical protein HW555_004684 [Spodoptera exigua]|uniref:Retrotransposon gag domain-containing protein n=1 Tax=Spodoptera exigua TaxID=7107 RepID=A0A835L623_SPOEX|nr:hypothetical protein HW555_004684 [Spodoptera exigua]
MDTETIGDLLKAIRDAISKTTQIDGDVALPVFDPEKCDNGAARWCNNIETLAKDLNWSSIKTAAKAGKALKGSALTWFESWDPLEGRSWEKFRADIIDAYPEKKNLSNRLQKAVLFTSDKADSYGEYAREKLRLLRNTTVSFTEDQLIELVCGGVSDVNVRMASLNSNVASTSLNAVKYPDVEIVTDSLGCRLVRKPIQTKAEVNLTSVSDLCELISKIDHLDSELQQKIKSIFEKYPSVLNNSSTVKTGELNLRLKRNETVNYRPYRLAPSEKEKSWLEVAQQNDPESLRLMDQVVAGDLDENREDRELARQRLQFEAIKFKNRFDACRRNTTNFEIGNTVYVNQDHRRHDKLSPRFKGPYLITGILPNDRYTLRGLGNSRSIIIAKDKLRLWPGEWVDDNESD